MWECNSSKITKKKVPMRLYKLQRVVFNKQFTVMPFWPNVKQISLRKKILDGVCMPSATIVMWIALFTALIELLRSILNLIK